MKVACTLYNQISERSLVVHDIASLLFSGRNDGFYYKYKSHILLAPNAMANQGFHYMNYIQMVTTSINHTYYLHQMPWQIKGFII